MKRFRDVSLGRKLTLAFLAAGIIPLVVAAALALLNELASQRPRGLRDLAALAEMIAVSTRATLDFDDAARAGETLATLDERAEIRAACLYTPDGRVFASYVRDSDAPFRFPPLPPIGARVSGEHLDYCRPVGSGREVSGYVYVVMDLRVLRAQLPRNLAVLSALLAALAALSFFISRRFQGIITRPILGLTHAAQAVRQTGDYTVRVEKDGDDEIGYVIDAFNQMLAGIEQRAAALEKLTESLRAEVAERQRAEAEAQVRSRQLEAAVKELEAFSYSVSHDLRTPLRAIDGFSKIVVTQHAGELSPDAARALERVRVNTQNMGALIDDLLGFARLNRQSLRIQAVSPGSLVDECLELLLQEPDGRNVEIVRSPLPPCQADPGLLKVVWMNLLSNALKYTRRRDPARIDIGSRTQDTTVYYVRDNGVGFNMAYADKLYGVFQRLHRAEDYEGTGVGLATVQRIVSRHGGRVWAEAEPDRGASFYFTLEPETAA